jgi:hypothetical protein
MKIIQKFLIAEAVWGTGIFVLMIFITRLDPDPLTASHYVNWLGHAFGLAMFPAGIAVSHDVFPAGESRRRLLAAAAAAGAVALFLFVLTAFIAPRLGDGTRSLWQLMSDMNAVAAGWEKRNDAAWRFFSVLFKPVNALLFAAIGLQVGVWARYALPFVMRRVLYWAVGLGLLISGFSVYDTTYETIVLSTSADVSFAAFYTLMIPAALCAGLALPTLALLRGAKIPESTG